MKNWKKYAGLLLALVMCLSLAACGGDEEGAPATIEGLVIDDPVEYDYSAFLGTWVGTDGTTLTVEKDSGEGAPFALLDRYGDPYTGGVLQYR